MNEQEGYNYETMKVDINMTWNLQLLTSLLQNYHDREIPQFLRYGFPVEHDDDSPLILSGINHKGATDFPEHIENYLEKERSMGATIGPFECIPFKGPVAISPLSTQPKKESNVRRVIMDCSWPIGASLNDGMSKDKYLSQDIQLKYPTIDSLARRVFELKSKNPEKSIFFFKEDLDRAFRQLRGDPKSAPLLGYKWRGRFYFDLVMVMGLGLHRTFVRGLRI